MKYDDIKDQSLWVCFHVSYAVRLYDKSGNYSEAGQNVFCWGENYAQYDEVEDIQARHDKTFSYIFYRTREV